MPFYTFEDRNTQEEITLEMTIAEREEYLKANPDKFQIITNASMVHDVGGIKTDNGWKSLLNRIKKNNHGSTINSGNLGEI
jgi:hypothetical protein